MVCYSNAYNSGFGNSRQACDIIPFTIGIINNLASNCVLCHLLCVNNTKADIFSIEITNIQAFLKVSNTYDVETVIRIFRFKLIVQASTCDVYSSIL